MRNGLKKSFFLFDFLKRHLIQLLGAGTLQYFKDDGCAQCFPRLACPLNGAVLMQVHETAQAAPGLVRERLKKVRKHMQNHAPWGCMA